MSQEEFHDTLEGIKSERMMRTSVTMEKFVPGTSLSVFYRKIKGIFWFQQSARTIKN